MAPVIDSVFHRILDLKRGWISILASFFLGRRQEAAGNRYKRQVDDNEFSCDPRNLQPKTYNLTT